MNIPLTELDTDRPIITHTVWSQSEVDSLRRHAAAGDALGYIATLLNRTVQGCAMVARKYEIDLSASRAGERRAKVIKREAAVEQFVLSKEDRIAALYAGRRYTDDPNPVRPDYRRNVTAAPSRSSSMTAAAMCVETGSGSGGFSPAGLHTTHGDIGRNIRSGGF
jgi:hypothetical protein